MTRPNPGKAALLALVLAASLGACKAEQFGDTAARTGLGIVRGACHAGSNCGVSCPEGSSLDRATLACRPAPP